MKTNFLKSNLLHNEPKLPYTIHHAVSWLLQIARAVNYLHTRQPKPTIHRYKLIKILTIVTLN